MTINKRYAAAALGCLLAWTTAVAWSAPRAVKASYNGYMNGVPIGVIHEHFETNGATYRIESDSQPTVVAAIFTRQPRRFSSAGQLTRDGLRPAQFVARRTAGEVPQASAEFDWAHGQLLLKHDGTSESFPIAAGTQDRLSVMYQWMFLPIDRLRELEFAMTNGRKLERYRYRVTPDVEIDTPLGRLKTFHLVKLREPGATQTEFWLSAKHRHFPVKVVYIEKGGIRFEQRIQSLEIDD